MTQTPAAGWIRLLVASAAGGGPSFSVLDGSGGTVMEVDGRLGASPRAAVIDPVGAVLYRVKGQFLGIPKRMVIARDDGTEVAELRAKLFSALRSTMTVRLAGGHEWQVEGTIAEQDYRIAADGAAVAIRDQSSIGFRTSCDPGMIVAAVWAIDRWVERG